MKKIFNTKTILFIICIMMMGIGSLQFYELKKMSAYNINNSKTLVDSDYYVNSQNKLSLLSSYGDHQAYHPKVLYFKNGWNGYDYWMSFTPYPYSDSNKENPHIVVSDDMVNWHEFEKFENPLDEVKNTANGKRYNSDSHIVYNSDNDTLECWWRFVDDVEDKVTIYRSVTEDGLNWSEKEKIITAKRSEKDYVSPAIIYEDNIYKMWYVYRNTVYYIESEDLENWSKPINMKIEYQESVNSWHLDVIHTDNGYEMILVAYYSWEDRNKMNLYYTKSDDNMVWDIAKIILTPTTNTLRWDNSGLYRSSILYIDDTYYIYYSGQGTNNAKGTGLVYGNDVFDLRSYDY